MQHPTCINLRIRNVADANPVLHAVRLNILPMVHRRLDDQERLALRPGSVYVWEERSNNPLEATGQEIQRFTEGRCWGPSRAREDFLLYYEKEATNKSSILQRIGSLSEPLIKQTYSVYINGSRSGPKWHLNAYYTHETADQLRTVDQIPALRNIQVPDSLYIPSRSTAARRSSRPSGGQRSSLDEGTVREPQNSRSSDPPPQAHRLPQSSSSFGPTLRPIRPAAKPTDDEEDFPRLAPLEYLENISPPRRHNIDDDYLRQFRNVSCI
ncbi:unnamed protein product [Somion occarium]